MTALDRPPLSVERLRELLDSGTVTEGPWWLTEPQPFV